MTPRRALPVLALALGLAGCGSGSSGTQASPPSPTLSPSPAAAPVLVLEPDGLGVLVGASSIRQLPFASTTAAQITTVLTNVLGAGKASDLPECGQGARSSYQVKGFSLLFDGTTWVGWTDQGAAGRTLSTADGVGIGITLATLQSIRPGAKVNTESLGAEFVEDGYLGGFLSGTKATSTVTSVYAGETCLFR